jgi:hypothetical protein
VPKQPPSPRRSRPRRGSPTPDAPRRTSCPRRGSPLRCTPRRVTGRAVLELAPSAGVASPRPKPRQQRRFCGGQRAIPGSGPRARAQAKLLAPSAWGRHSKKYRGDHPRYSSLEEIIRKTEQQAAHKKKGKRKLSFVYLYIVQIHFVRLLRTGGEPTHLF